MFDRNIENQVDLVYRAEDSVAESTRGQRFQRLDDIRDWVGGIIESRWFRTRFPNVMGVEIRDFRGRPGRGCDWRDKDDICHILLSRELRVPLFVLHELTHGIEPGLHGRNFCATYLALVKRFMGWDAWSDLRIQFLVFDVVHRRRPQRWVWFDDEMSTGF
jgi:putative metallohydrolase (TIGR04338 family)